MDARLMIVGFAFAMDYPYLASPSTMGLRSLALGDARWSRKAGALAAPPGYNSSASPPGLAPASVNKR